MLTIINDITTNGIPGSEMKPKRFYVVVASGRTSHKEGEVLYTCDKALGNCYQSLKGELYGSDYTTFSPSFRVREVNVELKITGYA